MFGSSLKKWIISGGALASRMGNRSRLYPVPRLTADLIGNRERDPLGILATAVVRAGNFFMDRAEDGLPVSPEEVVVQIDALNMQLVTAAAMQLDRDILVRAALDSLVRAVSPLVADGGAQSLEPVKRLIDHLKACQPS